MVKLNQVKALNGDLKARQLLLERSYGKAKIRNETAKEEKPKTEEEIFKSLQALGVLKEPPLELNTEVMEEATLDLSSKKVD